MTWNAVRPNTGHVGRTLTLSKSGKGRLVKKLWTGNGEVARSNSAPKSDPLDVCCLCLHAIYISFEPHSKFISGLPAKTWPGNMFST